MNNQQNKTLLFLGGGRSNLGAIQTAKSLGYTCYVAGTAGDYPCNQYADKLIDVNMMDKVATYNAVKDLNIDGVLICCSDKALETCGYICDKLHLPGITEKSAILSANKYEMKKALMDEGVSTARFVKVSSDEDLKQAVSRLSFPLMAKAVDLQGSKGVYKTDTEAELLESFKKIQEESNAGYCIVEEYIEGKEMGAQSFIYNGKVLFVQPHGDVISHFGNVSAPTGHYIPVALCNDTIISIETEVKKAIKALGLNNCAVNVDFIIKEGKPYILELTGRVGANCLPMMMSYHFGFDYYKMIVSMAVGDNPVLYYNPVKQNKTTMTRMLVSSVCGTIKEIHDFDSILPYKSLFVKRGNNIHTYRSANDCIGEALYQGETIDDCMKHLTEYNNTLNVIIEKNINNDTI